MTDRDQALRFDINTIDQAFLDDPFPIYRALRDHDPGPTRIPMAAIS